MTFVVDIDVNGHKISARQDDDDDNEIDSGKGNKGDKDGQGEIELGQQQDGEEDFSESSEQTDGPGGLVGLITNLSGVNALIFYLKIEQIF